MSVWVVLALTCLSVQAAEPAAQVFLLPAAERIHVEDFSRHVDLLEDPSGKLSVDDATRSTFAPATLAAEDRKSVV